MSEEEKVPTWLYRMGDDGKIEAKIFHIGKSDDLESGWKDNPEDCRPKKRGPGRPPKAAEPASDDAA